MNLSYIAALARDNLQSFFVDFGYMPQESEIAKSPVQPSVSNTQLFNQALVLQQQKKYDESLALYQKILDQSPNDLGGSQASVIYHNMSTIAYEKGDVLKAYVWSKKSVHLNPGNQLARESFQFYSKKFEVPVIPHQISNYDNFKKIISKVSVDAWFVLGLVLIFVTLWTAVRNFLTGKKNQLAGIFTTPPKWPPILMTFLTLAVLSMAYINYQDSSTLRALVIVEKAQVQTAPGQNKSVIYEAPAGLELEVLNFDQGYFQVRYSGAFSGWVNKSQVELLSLTFEQNK